MATKNDILTNFVRFLYAFVVLFSLILVAITIHGFYPVIDPISPITFLDKLSYLFGVHEKSAVVIIDLGLYSTTVYTYIFHRHISDGSFHIGKEYKTPILPGIFDDISKNPASLLNSSILDNRIDEILDAASMHLPSTIFHLRLRPYDCQSSDCLPPILVRVSNEAIKVNSRQKITPILQTLHRRLDNNSSFYFHPEKSFGVLTNSIDETALNWFAIGLLKHSFVGKDWKIQSSPIILDVAEKDLYITMAVSSNQILPNDEEQKRVISIRHLMAFDHSIKVITLKYQDLGLYAARNHVFGLSSDPSVYTSRDGTSGIDVRSACVNPVSDAFWEWQGTTFHVRGVVNGTYELVRERNGPFAGKKINRPVAKYDYCHRVCSSYVSQKLRATFEEDQKDAGGGDVDTDKVLSDSLKNGRRPVFIKGFLREKCIERGLTLPDSGGDIKMRAFLDSLKHACKVPNTEQPFACLDLMFLGTLLDQLLGFKQGSMLYSTNHIGGMDGHWPLSLAFDIYQNGL